MSKVSLDCALDHLNAAWSATDPTFHGEVVWMRIATSGS